MRLPQPAEEMVHSTSCEHFWVLWVTCVLGVVLEETDALEVGVLISSIE